MPQTTSDWVDEAIARERNLLERSRRRFVDEPTEECLHAVRTTGRRLRSLLEDVAGVRASPRLAKQAKRAAQKTDEARDAAVLLDLLERALHDGERTEAARLIESLTKRERKATKSARKNLRRMRFRKP